MATSEGIPSSIDIEFLELNDNPYISKWVVVICSKFITFAVTKTTSSSYLPYQYGCDLLKIHYLCGNKDNLSDYQWPMDDVVICSKFITFAVTKTTRSLFIVKVILL